MGIVIGIGAWIIILLFMSGFVLWIMSAFIPFLKGLIRHYKIIK